MSRTLFENSKAALAFAGMTILGAVVMIGTSEREGVLSSIDEQLAAQPVNVTADVQVSADAQSVSEPPPAKGSGWGSEGSVFGDFDPISGKQPTTASDPASPAKGDSVMTAPLAPGAVVDDQVNPGAQAPNGVAVITSSEMTIQPN